MKLVEIAGGETWADLLNEAIEKFEPEVGKIRDEISDSLTKLLEDIGCHFVSIHMSHLETNTTSHKIDIGDWSIAFDYEGIPGSLGFNAPVIDERYGGKHERYGWQKHSQVVKALVWGHYKIHDEHFLYNLHDEPESLAMHDNRNKIPHDHGEKWNVAESEEFYNVSELKRAVLSVYHKMNDKA